MDRPQRWSTSAIRRVITERWFPPIRPPLCTGRVGITRHTSAPTESGTGGRIPTESEQDLPTAPPPVGALGLVTDTGTIPGTTHGGGRWGIGDAAGIRTTDGVRGAERR